MRHCKEQATNYSKEEHLLRTIQSEAPPPMI